MEQVPTDRGHVGEDPDPEDDDHAGRELTADAQLVAEEDDARGDHHVADEGDDEDLVVEDPVEVGAQPAEHGVERRDHRDREVRVERLGYGRAQHQPEDDAHDETQHGDHGASSWLSSPPCPAYRSASWLSGADGSRSSGSLCRSTTKPNCSASAWKPAPDVVARSRLSRSDGPMAE